MSSMRSTRSFFEPHVLLLDRLQPLGVVKPIAPWQLTSPPCGRHQIRKSGFGVWDVASGKSLAAL